MHEGLKLVLLCASRRGYQTLCRIITHARRAADKGEYRLTRDDLQQILRQSDPGDGLLALWIRSEEHTSELQSLMRISYAVFCLKKINKQQHNTTTLHLTTNTPHIQSH